MKNFNYVKILEPQKLCSRIFCKDKAILLEKLIGMEAVTSAGTARAENPIFSGSIPKKFSWSRARETRPPEWKSAPLSTFH